MTDIDLNAIRARHKSSSYDQTAGCNCFEQCWADRDALLTEVGRLREELDTTRRLYLQTPGTVYEATDEINRRVNVQETMKKWKSDNGN